MGYARNALQEYLKTTDITLLASANFTAVALRTMDALESISAKSLEGPIKKFILAGHSRCGLTAAYAAEIDPRVIGIISIGAPAMNFPEQIARDEEFIINAMSGEVVSHTPVDEMLVQAQALYEQHRDAIEAVIL